MKSALLLSILLAGALAAQELKKPEEGKPQVQQKVFILKYADPNKLASTLGIFGGHISPNADLHVLAVAASPEIMPAIEDAIKRLDTPAAGLQDIDLTAYYLIGGDAETPGSPPPKELDSVIAQLKNSFAFKNYRLLDMLELRSRPQRSADTSSSPGPVAPGSPSVVTQLHTGSLSLSADGATVNVEGMKAGIRLPTPAGPGGQFTFIDLGLNANVDIKENQKVVVGRLSVNKDQALFLVLTARVVN